DDGDVLLDAGAPAYLNPRVRNLRAPAISWGAGASSQASSVPAVPRASTFERRGTPVRPYRNHGTRRPTYPALRPRLGIVGATTAERTLMKPRITLITLTVDDLERALRFYRDGLGLPTRGIVGEESEHGAVAFFEL